jgi:hypothetical protein
MEARARKGATPTVYTSKLCTQVHKRCKTRVRGFVNSHMRTGR